MEGEQRADDRHEEHAAADTRQHRDDADREAHDEERDRPDPPGNGGGVHHLLVMLAIMPKLAANLSMLFPQIEFLERFAAARKAGFRYVEYQFPYGWRAEDIAQRVEAAG